MTYTQTAGKGKTMSDDSEKQIKAMREHVLTSARIERHDVAELPGSKGGLSFRTLSYFDVLLENKTIDDSQYGMGMIYWGLKDTAFNFLQMRIGKYDYTPPHEDGMLEAIETHEDNAEEGISTEIYKGLGKALHQLYRDALNACCCTLDSTHLPNRMAIFWAFNEVTLQKAFEELERVYPNVKEDAINRVNSPCKVRENA